MSASKVMRAIRVSEFGGPSVLKLCSDVAVPEPGHRQVRPVTLSAVTGHQCRTNGAIVLWLFLLCRLLLPLLNRVWPLPNPKDLTLKPNHDLDKWKCATIRHSIAIKSGQKTRKYRLRLSLSILHFFLSLQRSVARWIISQWPLMMCISISLLIYWSLIKVHKTWSEILQKIEIFNSTYLWFICEFIAL